LERVNNRHAVVQIDIFYTIATSLIFSWSHSVFFCICTRVGCFWWLCCSPCCSWRGHQISYDDCFFLYIFVLCKFENIFIEL